jgi:glycosyltransferase involved in cell wall biosynthesis
VIVTVFSVYAPVFNFLYRKNVILEFYHLMGRKTVDKYGIFGWFPFLFERIMLKNAREIITMAPGTKKAVLDQYPDKNVYALPCGFDEKQLELTPENGKYVLVFGRIDVYMKGLDRLVPVMSKILENKPGYRLVIAGRGSEEDIRKLQKIIKNANLDDQTEIVINPEYSVKLELFRRCTYIAIFSRFEGWCIVAIEAAAAGKAILGVDVEGLRDSVVNGYNGVLVEDFNVPELINIGRKLISDDLFRAGYEQNARVHASQFTWEKIAEMQEKVYKNFLEKKNE